MIYHEISVCRVWLKSFGCIIFNNFKFSTNQTYYAVVYGLKRCVFVASRNVFGTIAMCYIYSNATLIFRSQISDSFISFCLFFFKIHRWSTYKSSSCKWGQQSKLFSRYPDWLNISVFWTLFLSRGAFPGLCDWGFEIYCRVDNLWWPAWCCLFRVRLQSIMCLISSYVLINSILFSFWLNSYLIGSSQVFHGETGHGRVCTHTKNM